MQIIPLSEGAFTIDSTKKFVPFDQSKDILQNRPSGSLLVEIQPFLIITSTDILLVDTGLGHMDSNRDLQIHKNLSLYGINASDVTKVLMSHLHKDHAGGISFLSEGHPTLSFKNATYYINRDEFNTALEKPSPSYNIKQFDLLINNDRLQLTGSNGVIDDFITYEVTGGHSQFHQVFWITEDSHKVFFGGDVAPQLQQMKRRFIAKYDADGKKSMELREEWWKEGEKEKWTFLFYHDIKSPVFNF